MNFVSLFVNRYVRHSLTVVAGVLVQKGVVNADVAGSVVNSVTDFALAAGLGVTAIVFSKLSDKLKLG